MNEPQFIRNIRFECRYMFDELILKIKHPTRPGDFYSHWCNLWDHIIFHPWYCLKRGIRNLVIWFPLIWLNDCWDHHFLTGLMDKQMKEMEDFFGSDKPHLMNASQVYKRIKWTRKLYTMWKDDYYSMKHYNQHHEKWVKEKHKSFFDPLNSVACAWDEWGIPTMFKSKNTMSDEEVADYRVGSDKAYKMDEKVFKLYIKNLSRMREWWD